MAARAARGLLEDWYVGGAGSHAVTDHLRAGLSGLAPSGPRSRLGGSMRRAFPTTMAALVYQADRQHVWWEVLWAGDSRCYVADPETGLHQLSRDDTDSQDALELLTQDPPMTNMVCADRRFTVHAVEGGARLPCVLVCATDGFFGYVRTPAEFEHLLLDTLTNAQDGTHWAALITEAVTGFTGDDATLALVALGFTDFRDLRAHFRRRAEHLSAEHAAPMRSLDGTDRSALVAARTDSWRRYRPSYESRLPLKEEM